MEVLYNRIKPNLMNMCSVWKGRAQNALYGKSNSFKERFLRPVTNQQLSFYYYIAFLHSYTANKAENWEM